MVKVIRGEGLLCGIVETAHPSASFWTEALGLARRAVNFRSASK